MPNYVWPTVESGQANHWYYTPANGSYVPVVIAPDVFGDLLSHAPGMETSVSDSLAGFDAENQDAPKLGDVDAAAAKLIKAARSGGWESIKRTNVNGEFSVTFDGSGRMRLSRKVSAGLREEIVCDGKSLWHIYPDLMLGAKRSVSRLHRQDLQSFVPWLLASVDDLRVGSHIRLIDANTVSVEPIDRESGKPFVVMRLKFKGNRLVERRMVEMPSGKTLVSESYSNDGTMVVRNGKNKEILRQAFDRQTDVAKPQLTPTLEEDTVVLPLPYRPVEKSADLVDFNKPLQPQVEKLSDEECMQVVATAFGNKLTQLKPLVIALRGAKHDLRAGLIVLRFLGQPLDTTTTFDPKHQGSAIASFFTQHRNWLMSRSYTVEMKLPEDPPEFFNYLVTAHNLHRRWVSGEMVRRAIGKDFERQMWIVKRFVQKGKSPRVAETLLRAVNHQLLSLKEISQTSKQLMSEATAELAQDNPLSSFSELRATWLARSGGFEQASKLYSQRVLAASRLGIRFQLNLELRQAYLKQDGGKEKWQSLVKEVMQNFAKLGDRGAVLSLATQAHNTKDKELSDTGLKLVAKDVDFADRPLLLEAVMNFHRARGDWKDADKRFEQLIDMRDFAKIPMLWRQGAAIAHFGGDLDKELRRIERAVELEYESWPEKIDLNLVRQRFGELLDKFAALGNSKDQKRSLPADFAERVIRIADRWRSLDPNITTACQKAAAALHAAGYRKMAWDYWTTPLALSPNEASGWLALAKNLQGKALNDLADEAYTEAYAAERTNAQILWDHANLLRTTGKKDRARAMVEQLANGAWQPRFQPLKSQARGLLNNASAW